MTETLELVRDGIYEGHDGTERYIHKFDGGEDRLVYYCGIENQERAHTQRRCRESFFRKWAKRRVGTRNGKQYYYFDPLNPTSYFYGQGKKQASA